MGFMSFELPQISNTVGIDVIVEIGVVSPDFRKPINTKSVPNSRPCCWGGQGQYVRTVWVSISGSIVPSFLHFLHCELRRYSCPAYSDTQVGRSRVVAQDPYPTGVYPWLKIRTQPFGHLISGEME